MNDFNKAKEQLVDLREKYADNETAQNFALSRHYPHLYNTAALKEVGLDAGKFSKEEFDSLDASICVMRHLFAHVGGKWRVGNDDNPIEPMVWADLAQSSGAAQTCVRYHIIELLRRKYGDTLSSLSLFNIMENEDTHNTVWSRDAFMLWHKAVFERIQGTKNWTQVEYKLPWKMAEISLLEYDGRKPLGERISSEFGPERNTEEGIELHWQSNNPAIVRIHYDNSRPRSVSRSFNELARITVDGQRAIEEEDENGRTRLVLKPGRKDPIHYQLIASVKLSDQEDREDRIRLYRIDGEPLQHHISLVGRFTGGRWKLGDKNEFMLYYTPVPYHRRIDGREPPEVADGAEMSALQQMIDFSHSGERNDGGEGGEGEGEGESSQGKQGKILQYSSWRGSFNRGA